MRSYSSPLRAEQTALTRRRILDAAVEILNERDAGDLAMQDVADRAGVSVRTVYRHFASRDELLDGLVGAIDEQLVAVAGPPPATADEYVEVGASVIPAVFQVEPLYRALFATRAGRESHVRSAHRRRAEIAYAFADELAALDDDDARLATAILHLVTSSKAVLFLKDYWELDPDETGRAIAWAMGVLTDALRDPEARRRLAASGRDGA